MAKKCQLCGAVPVLVSIIPALFGAVPAGYFRLGPAEALIGRKWSYHGGWF